MFSPGLTARCCVQLHKGNNLAPCEYRLYHTGLDQIILDFHSKQDNGTAEDTEKQRLRGNGLRLCCVSTKTLRCAAHRHNPRTV